jgi:hypothetical protein
MALTPRIVLLPPPHHAVIRVGAAAIEVEVLHVSCTIVVIVVVRTGLHSVSLHLPQQRPRSLRTLSLALVYELQEEARLLLLGSFNVLLRGIGGLVSV